MRLPAISFLILSLLFNVGEAAGKQKSSQRIGDLVVTLLGIEEREAATSNHHTVTIGLQAENVGKQALCLSFGSTLKATFGLEYHGFGSQHPLQVRELLPGEKTDGEFDFLVKDGVEPLELVLKPLSHTQTCTRGRDSPSAIWHNASEVRFGLTGPQGGPSQEQPALTPPAAEELGVRVFLADAKGSAAQGNLIKVFQDHCPQAQITTAKEKANYVVQLTPKSLTRSKNTILVANADGDVIHSGATINLGNAVKDACTAILSETGTRSKH